MVFKASILLLFVFSLVRPSAWAETSESDLNQAIQKKNWPEVVLLLAPLQGQNFDHDVTLVRAYLFLERRSEALVLATALYTNHKDDKTRSLLEMAGSIFFSQETSNLYYEAIRLISTSEFKEAKDRLDQALVKEPDQVLVLTRLAQVDLVLGHRDQAATHLALAQKFAPFSNELKLLGAKLFSLSSVSASESDSEQDAYAEFSPIKTQLLENEVTAQLWFQALLSAKKSVDLVALSKKILKENPAWTAALFWFYKNGNLNMADRTKFKIQIEKNLKDKNQFNGNLESEMKQSQYFWVGYFTYETLQSQYNLLNQLK